MKLKGGAGGIVTRSGKRAKEIEVCSHCGQPLVELLWGKSDGQRMYILICDNPGCPCYRNPVRTITREATVIQCPHCGSDSPLDSTICVKCGKVIRRKLK